MIDLLPWLFCLPCIAVVGSTSLVRSEVAADASPRTSQHHPHEADDTQKAQLFSAWKSVARRGSAVRRKGREQFNEVRARRSLEEAQDQSQKVTPTAGSSRIPHQFITTGKAAFENIGQEFSDNMRRTQSLNPHMRLRYLSDQDCYNYLKRHYNETEIPELYKNEKIGMYRGDICRAAVLAREGGYYLDMDMYPLVPFEEFAGPEVTFMTVLTMGRTALLNAMMAATPGHPIMLDSLKVIPEWYRTHGHWNLTGQLGMGATWDGLSKFLSNNCPTVALRTVPSLWPSVPCGNNDSIVMFEEVFCDRQGHTCPADRQEDIVKDGIYDSTGRQIAWSRFSTCKTFSCGGTGREEQAAGVSFSQAQLKKQSLLATTEVN